MTEKKKQLIVLLQSDINVMHKAAKALELSWKGCRLLASNKKSTQANMDALELLSSRFARLTDFLIQRIFRLIDQIDLETEGTVRDIIHRAEKKLLIDSADEFIEARLLRNKIAHEYAAEVMTEIFLAAVRLVPMLLDATKRVEAYAARYYPNSPGKRQKKGPGLGRNEPR